MGGAKEGKLDFQRMWKVKGLYVGPLESEFHVESGRQGGGLEQGSWPRRTRENSTQITQFT